MTLDDLPGGTATELASTSSGDASTVLRTTDAAVDPTWDAFLARVGAHHTQTSAWARVKEADGWRPLRVTLVGPDGITAGTQLLYRRLPGIGRVAYVSRGPVLATHDQRAGARLIAAVWEATRAARIRAALIEPDPRSPLTPGPSPHHPLVPAHQRLSLGATVRVDISQPPAAILAGMRSKTRYNVRRAEKRSISVRRADAGDLPTFHRLLVQTGRRQGFDPGPASRYRRWFDVLAGDGLLHLFLAEHDGEPVSAMLAIAFGDTVVYKRGAWSGRHGDLRPNEALHWAAMRWGHEAGYRWYDLDGIDRDPAERAIRGQVVPERYLSSVARFKLGFGGEIVLLPDSLALLPTTLPRWLYTRLGSRLAGAKRLRRSLARPG